MTSTHDIQEEQMTAEALTDVKASTSEASSRGSRSLDTYRLLGRSGLRVSPLALGAMTFGPDWGWGADRTRRAAVRHLHRARRQLHRHRQPLHQRNVRATHRRIRPGRRDWLVIATKYTLPDAPGDPNSGGNHRKSMVASVERACSG